MDQAFKLQFNCVLFFFFIRSEYRYHVNQIGNAMDYIYRAGLSSLCVCATFFSRLVACAVCQWHFVFGQNE